MYKGKKQYFFEVSFIRAIACLCIVMVHVSAGFYYENGNTFDSFTQFFNQITRFGTPAFAMISGFLLYNQVINRSFKLRFFWKSRITKVVTPFIVWSVFYLILKYFYGQFTLPTFSTVDETKNFIYFFFTGDSNYHLYFIMIVVQFYVLFSFIHKFKSRNQLIILTLIAFFINYFFVQHSFDIRDGYVNILLNDRVFLFHWIYYFFIGGLLVHVWNPLMEWVKKNLLFSLSLGLIVVIGGIVEYQIVDWVATNRVINMINLPILFIAGASIYYLLKAAPTLRNGMLQIGNLSMGIYLVHPMILFFIRRYEIFTWVYDYSFMLPILFLFTMAMSIAVVKLIQELPFGQYIVTVAKPIKTEVPAAERKQRVS
ncbi:acyltransferase [Oceanobacillus sp. CAU 1775]